MSAFLGGEQQAQARELMPAPTPTIFRKPRVIIENAPRVTFPGATDSNSPSFWDERGFHIFTSNQNPAISSGSSLENLGLPTYTQFLDGLGIKRWIEGIYRDPQGTLWALYHREDYKNECPDRPYFTVPTIGIAVSYDGGYHWQDLGLVLKDFGIDDSCEASINTYFAGGVGDPSWAIDERSGIAYILYSSYSGGTQNQGVQLARLRLSDLNQPVGNVWRWDGHGWSEAGLGGVGASVLPARTSWHEPDSDVFWGPSIHWNTYLGMFVVLLNRTAGPDFTQEGAYISFVYDITDPHSWTEPEKILDGGHWYVQVVGDPAIRGTDSWAGQVSRLFVYGQSEWLIRFER